MDARLQRASIALAAFAAALGLAGLLSWTLHMPALRNFGVGVTGMSPLTGVSLMASAAAIIAARYGAPTLQRLSGALVMTIGAVVLGEWSLGVRGGIAQLLLPIGDRGELTGRVSVPAAAMFVAVGAALVFLRRGPSPLRRPSDYLALLAALGAFTVVTAYSYGATSFAPVLGAANTGMALPTGIAMFALAVSILLVEPRRGLASILLADEPGGFFARRVVLFATLIPPAFGVLVRAGRESGVRDVLGQLAFLIVATSAIATFAVLLAAHRLNLSAAQSHRAEANLRIAEARSRDLIENAPDALLTVDDRGDVIVANARAAALFGRDILNVSLAELLPGVIEHARAESPLDVTLTTPNGAVPLEITASRVTTGVVQTTLILRDISERRRAEELERFTEARFRMLFEHSTDGVFFASPDGRYVDVNEAGCRLLGATRDQIVGRFIADFLAPEDVPRIIADREDILAGATRVSEWKMRKGDGSWADVEVATRLLPDGRWVGLARDISHRKAAEEKIRKAHEAEQRLRRQVEAISDATSAVAEAVTRLPQSDVRAVLHTIVLQAQAITGARYGALGIGGDGDHPFDPWVVTGMPDEVAKQIGRAPRPLGLLGSVAREGKCLRIDDVGAAPGFRGFPSGHPVLKTLLGVPIRYQNRSIGNLYLADKTDGTTFTADDQRALEILADRVGVALETARLYDTEARERSWLQVTIDQMPEPVLLADACGHVGSWNRAASALARADLAGVQGIPFDLRWPSGKPLADHEHPLHRACVDGELVTGVELVAITADGRHVPVLASAAPLPQRERDKRGAVAILQDITQQKELERLREEWTAIVAHDLRAPIASIALSAQLLQRRSLGVEDAKLVDRIQSGAQRVRGMVDDLLDYAQIEAGRLRITPRSVDLTPLVAEAVERIAPTTPAHPVRLVTKQVDAHTEADPGRIEQVVTNLVSNATKYGYPDTEVVVTIGGRDDEIELTVENHGPGMRPDELARLFARFERMATAEAGGVKGIGLGLFITKGIVEAHGGRIWAESTPHETTTFHVVLPARPHPRAA